MERVSHAEAHRVTPVDELALVLLNRNDRAIGAVGRAIDTSADPRCDVRSVVRSTAELAEQFGRELDGEADVLVLVTDMLTKRDVELVAEFREAQPKVSILVVHRNASSTRTAATIAAGAAEVVQFRADDPTSIHAGIKNLVARRRAATKTVGELLSDPVTGLLNRSALTERLASAIRETARPEEDLTLLYMDLDRFKQINDSLGHSAGDRVLSIVARQLEAAVGETIAKEASCRATIARFGGDEFVLLVEGPEAAWAARRLAHRILVRLRRPVVLADHAPVVTPSIGLAVALYGDEPDRWIERADMALYRAKSRGRNRVEEFDRSLEAWAEHTHRRSEELRRAVYSGGLSLSVSAVEWCDTGELESLIAVPMWQGSTPLFGRELQRVADQCGLGPELGRWAIEEGIRLAANRSRPVAVPLAQCLLTLAGTVEFIEAALDEGRVPPSQLRLLIDEDGLGEDELLASVIDSFRSLGVGLVVNGFGAGVGSLCALSRYRLDAVVLAPDLVVGLGASPKQVALVDGVLRAVQALGYLTIAPTLMSSSDRARVHRLECEQEIVPIIDLPGDGIRRQPRLFRTAGHGAFAE